LHYSTYFSSIISISFHYSNCLSSIFSLSFHYLTYLSSIFSLICLLFDLRVFYIVHIL
jgi:hypothetical protein